MKIRNFALAMLVAGGFRRQALPATETLGQRSATPFWTLIQAPTKRVPAKLNSWEKLCDESRAVAINSVLSIRRDLLVSFLISGDDDLRSTAIIFSPQPDEHERQLIVNFVEAYVALRWIGFSREAALDGAIPTRSPTPTQLPDQIRALVAQSIPHFPFSRVGKPVREQYSSFPWWPNGREVYRVVDKELAFLIVPEGGQVQILTIDAQEIAPMKRAIFQKAVRVVSWPNRSKMPSTRVC